MFSHVVLGSNDIARSRKFYDAIIGAIGGNPATPDEKGRLAYQHNNSLLIITPPLNGEPATHANGGTIGFAMASPEQADAWHAAGVSAGGTSCEDPPGRREMGSISMYLAYLRDPDGNKLCAMSWMG